MKEIRMGRSLQRREVPCIRVTERVWELFRFEFSRVGGSMLGDSGNAATEEVRRMMVDRRECE